MPRAPKPKDVRQNRERRDIGQVPEEAPVLEIPRPPAGLLRATRRSWARYWASPARVAIVESLDLDTIERLWTLYDERARAYRELRKARVVTGSTGQERPSGFYTVITRLDAEIRQLEDRIAKHMKSRLTLGMVVGGDDRSDDDDEPSGSDDLPPEPPDDHPDPRLYVVGRTG